MTLLLAGWLMLVPLIVIGPTGQNAPSTNTAAVVDVTIVDVTTGALQPGMTVVISGNRIAAVGQADAVDVPAGATLIAGEGRFLIPGLWDMHIHFNHARQFELPLYIANGVTGVRNMSGDCEAPCSDSLETLRGWRAEIEAGALVGPRVVASSMLFDGPAPMWGTTYSYALTDADEGRAMVHRARARGADFIKILDPPRDVYFAVLDEARSIGLDAVGHVPAGVTVAEASAVGQKSWEHFDTTELLACSSRREEGERLRTASHDGSPGAFDAYRRFLVESFDEAACAPFFELLKENGTWHVPTLAYYRVSARPDIAVAATAERTPYLPWAATAGPGEVSAERDALIRRYFSLQLAYVGAAHRAGVGLLAGTDVGMEHVAAGFSLHDELGLFVEAGLSPLDALRTATSAPAAFFGREHELGAIKAGYLADLVLLDANPAEDIANTRRISAVVANGRVFDRGALDELLAGLVRAHNDLLREGPRPVRRLVWADRRGSTELAPVEPSNYGALRLSPDGRHVAFETSHPSGDRHIWVADLATGELEQLTFEGPRNFSPVWSLDGRWIYFASNRGNRVGNADIWRVPSDGSGSAEIFYQAAGPQVPYSISPDGVWLAFEESWRKIGLVPLTGDGKARLLTDTPLVNEGAPTFSPDGRFIAFRANEGGMSQVYVREIATGERWRVPAEEGIPAGAPRWTRGGAEIVFMLGNPGQAQPFAVDITYGPEPSFSPPRQIFEWPAGAEGFDVTPDGERFLIVQRIPQRQ